VPALQHRRGVESRRTASDAHDALAFGGIQTPDDGGVPQRRVDEPDAHLGCHQAVGQLVQNRTQSCDPGINQHGRCNAAEGEQDQRDNGPPRLSPAAGVEHVLSTVDHAGTSLAAQSSRSLGASG
jgi:hypothetical protein